MQVVPIIDHAGDLRGQADGRALKEPAGEADGPGVHCRYFRPWRRWLDPHRMNVVRPNILRPRVRKGRLNDHEQRGQCREQKPPA